MRKKLAEKVAARQAELEAELQRLSQFGSKSAKKAKAVPPTGRAKKREKTGEGEQRAEPEAEQVSEAA